MNILNENLITPWKGFKEFHIIKRIEEDSNVVSFYLSAGDDVILPYFKPGQYIAIRVKAADGTYSKVRQYTLSKDYEKTFYRISVKREENGLISKKLCDELMVGDTVEITAPAGKFVLEESDRPLILIGGGIGITPMLTMAYSSTESDRSVHLIYSTQNSNHHSFRDEIVELSSYENIQSTIFYTRPLPEDEYNFDYKGRISMQWMEQNLPVDGDYYICGPVPFMKSIYQYLTAIGIDNSSIHYELFGPGSNLAKL